MKILEKLQKRLQEGKKDNKGFSLVELIIVIAIMAILVGIVGMAVIPQIENARKGSDTEVLDALAKEAVQAYLLVTEGVGEFEISIPIDEDSGVLDMEAASGHMTITGDATIGAKILDEFLKLDGNGERKLKSNAGRDAGAITITLDGDADSIAVLECGDLGPIESR